MRRFSASRFFDSILILSSSVKLTNSFLFSSSFSSRYRNTTSSAIRLLSSSSSSTDTTSSADPEDLQRWERMYGEAQNEKKEEAAAKKFATSPIRVVTFDLDNTLWNTSATIGAANDALAIFVREHQQKTERQSNPRVEVVMGELFRANHSRYCPLWEESYVGQKKPGPVLLTLLRKDALRSVLGTDDTIVDEAFTVWENARYANIPQHLANGVVESLQELREALPHVTVGAITDGNSNPLAIPILEGLFDFCVNAEQVGVSKPDPRVYHHAIQQHHSATTTDTVGPWWVHIGDDFVKDVVAAKTLGMRCIWARELILDQLKASAAAVPQPQRDEPPRSTTIDGQTVLQMSVGADDYLTDALEEEFADATVDSFREISETILQWHKDSLQDSPPLEVASTLPAPNQSPTITQTNSKAETSSSDTKFCIYCGEKLPRQARFCSACGEGQEG